MASNSRETGTFSLSYFKGILMVQRKILVWLCFTLLLPVGSFAQAGNIKGEVKDARTGETLVGANILIQGTTRGTITDLDGQYTLSDVTPGTYNIVVSYISYDSQIKQLRVLPGNVTELDISLQPATLAIESVKVTAAKRTDTELSLISSIKATSVVANGISGQQISRSQDKDAAEVIKRVPGITVYDDRFVVIRGLSERYNSVILNNITTPSTESDVRSFAFDLIPSNMIDNIIVYKTPSPDLPADFAGGCVQIFTKNNALDNTFSIMYGTSINTETTFDPFATYKGSSTDWLGYDNGLRAIPAGFPSTADFAKLVNNAGKTQDQISIDRQTITTLGRSFSKIWNVDTLKSALPDQKLTIFLSRRFVLAKMSVSTINTLNYSNTNDYNKMRRIQYYGTYNTYANAPDTSYRFIDDVYKNTVKVGAISNWSFIFGRNQKIEFRNLLNQLGSSRTTLRDGRDFYGGSYERSHELEYQSRTIYSGQVGGQFHFFHDRTMFNFTVGYSYANKNEPDLRRVSWLKNDDDPELGYYLSTSNAVTPDNLGRIYAYNYERIKSGGANITQSFLFRSLKAEIKTGVYLEDKNRSFRVRNLGFVEATGQFNFQLRFLPLDSVFLDKNIEYPKGLRIGESTPLSDSYKAGDKLMAAYLKITIPLTRFLSLNGGLRIEKNNQNLTSGADKDPSAKIDTLNYFPSLGLLLNLSKTMLFRFGYGKSVNRPEFREIAPYSYYNFEEKASYYGNPDLKNAYIDNYDIRYEWYPNNYDMLTLAAFYKKFKDPIELYLFPAGSNWNYQFNNVEDASSRGIELDIRKSLGSLAPSSFITRHLSHYTLLFNTALIKSETVTSSAVAREHTRPMQGQSPYIINGGIYYQNDSLGLMVSLLYNRIGKRITFVGDKTIPHIWEMPRNSLDFTVSKTIGKHFLVKAGIVNMLKEPVQYKSYLDVSVDTNNDGTSDKKERKWMITRSYYPGQLFNVNLTYTF